eukprot:TRINITY_DN11466_c0_g1_i2.p1 TRINITY_DN11466_c0_g1~~TRINITY_DN11466_c0_g1_i2.p1  ORF type:complete len:593 (+),score=116.81 TRINITY_DN11466_c0_g1_i2:56-1834(+)
MEPLLPQQQQSMSKWGWTFRRVAVCLTVSAGLAGSALLLVDNIRDQLWEHIRGVGANFLSSDLPENLVDIPGFGRIEGNAYKHSNAWRGIPFGHAPRFEPPQPKKPWQPEVLRAVDFGPACMHPSGYRPESVAEDCLYLNVFTPKRKVLEGSPKPVLVWLHGGGYTVGAGSDTHKEDVQEMVLTHEVIVVSINYRLGVFGFSGSEHLRSGVDGSTGNFGMQDQRLALKWIQDNIGAFGGDPKRVSVMGWSAGAASISVHLTAPLSRGLFQSAVMLSGGFTDWAALHMRDAEYAFSNVAACLHCDVSDRECFKKKPTEEVMNCGNGQWYGPVVDGIELTESPLDAIKAQSDVIDYSVPIIIGCAAEDKLIDIGRSATEEHLFSVLKGELQGDEAAVKTALKLYPLEAFAAEKDRYPSDWSPSYWAARQMLADRDFTCIMRQVAGVWHTKGQSFAYWYVWSQQQSFPPETMKQLKAASEAVDGKGSCYPCPGAGHGADMAFLFENDEKLDVDTVVEFGDILSDDYQNLLINFVWSAQPNHAPAEVNRWHVDLPNWNYYSESYSNALVFQAGQSAELFQYRKDKCDFWEANPSKR